MSKDSLQQDAIEELQALGLREYEAKCFVALTAMSAGTAREVSEQTDVPRTRVYEAARELESRGLVAVQHSTPQQFRAIPVAEAIRLLDEQRQSRIETLEESLRTLTERSSTAALDEPEVWSLRDASAVENRAEQLIDGAEEEVLLLLGERQSPWNGLTDQLRTALNRNLDVVVGTASEPVRRQLAESLPAQVLYQSDLDWLDAAGASPVSVGRLLLADERTLLASTVVDADGEVREQAVYGTGTSNGLIVVLRRLLNRELDLS